MASKKEKKKQDDMVATAKSRFKQAVDAESTNRARAIEAIRFVDLDEQWDDQTLRDRESNGRPCMVINKCSGVVKQISNDARQNKPRIKVRPYDDKADPRIAEIYNGLIRNIENASDADAAYDTGIDLAIKGGWGYWRVVTEYAGEDVFDQDIRIKRITNPLSVYLDPSAKEADRSDAKWGFITEVLSRKDFETEYPDAPAISWEQAGDGEDGAEWFTENGITVAEYYYKEPVKKTLLQIQSIQTGDYDTVDAEGLDVQEVELPVDEMGTTETKKVVMLESGPSIVLRERTYDSHKLMWCKMAGGEIIEGPIEQAGKYVPIVACIGDEAWVEGEPHYKSAFFHAMDAQRLYNWARSNAVETLALSPKQPFIGTPEMFEGHEEEWDRANSTPKMRLTANLDQGQLPQRQPISISDTGALQEAMQSADDIKATTGLFDASLGARGNETSGKAIIARQRESDTSTFHFPDNQARAIRFTGRILVDLIPKIYDTERVVRLLNPDGAEGWELINKRVPDPSSPQGYRVINDLSVGRYDVTCDVGPGYMTKRLEAADGMMNFLSAVPATAPVFLPRIAKNLDWPDSEEIGAELQKIFQPPPPPQPDPIAMKKAQIGLQKDMLDVQNKSANLQSQKLIDIKRVQDIQAQGAETDQRTYQVAQKAIIDTFRQMGMIP